MSTELVLLDATRAGVVVVTLNRPAVHNALNSEVVERLIEVFEELRGADGVRVIFLDGAGPNFSAGADIKWMKATADYTHADHMEDASAFAEMLHLLHTLPQPTVALIDGAARGGGVGLVAACDIAIATRRSDFAISEVKLGLVPATISPYVVKAIGERAMRRYALTAETFDADMAARLGLLTNVVEDESGLAEQAEIIGSAIFQNGPNAVHATKRLIEYVSERPVDDSLRTQTAKVTADIRLTDEAQEGLSAFLNKVSPEWAK